MIGNVEISGRFLQQDQLIGFETNNFFGKNNVGKGLEGKIRFVLIASAAAQLK